jgi:hypothetical protein
VIGAIAVAVPALAVVSARVRGEEHTALPKACKEVGEHTRQRLGGDVKERRVREDAIEGMRREIECEEALMQDRNAGMAARHLDEVRGAIEAHRVVASGLEIEQVAAGAATQVQDAKGSLPKDRVEQRLHVLGDIVVAGALPEGPGTPPVRLEGLGLDLLELCLAE